MSNPQDEVDVQPQPSESLTSAPDEPVTPAEPKKLTPAERMAKVREQGRIAAEKHDYHTCRCPWCCRRRNAEGLPHPPKVSQPKSQPTANLASPSELASPEVVHDRESCPCADCRRWRTDRATKAAQARYAKEAAAAFDWDHAPFADAEQHLGDMRREIERGARILQQRCSSSQQAFVQCSNPSCKADIPNGRWVKSSVVRDPATGLQKSLFFCSIACANTVSYHPEHHGPATGEPTGLNPTRR